MRPIVGEGDETAAGDFDYYTYGKYCGWASMGLKTVYYLANFGDYWLKGIFKFLPELFLFVLDMMKEFADFELGELGGIYDIVYQLVYELYAAEYSQMIAFFPIYLFMTLPGYANDDGEISDGLPFFNNAAELKIALIPNTWKFDHLAILYTMAWYLKVAAIVLKEMGHPFLKFDELSLAYIAAWNFFNDWWKYDFESMEYAFGVLVIQLPWFALAWFLFDGDFGSQDMFVEGH